MGTGVDFIPGAGVKMLLDYGSSPDRYKSTSGLPIGLRLEKKIEETIACLACE